MLSFSPDLSSVVCFLKRRRKMMGAKQSTHRRRQDGDIDIP
jgi:hypothetical protein